MSNDVTYIRYRCISCCLMTHKIKKYLCTVAVLIVCLEHSYHGDRNPSWSQTVEEGSWRSA